jgi:hypothetical protein
MPSHSKEKHGWGLGGLGWFPKARSIFDLGILGRNKRRTKLSEDALIN